MIFTQPLPFQEALDSAAVKSILPTTGRTADLQKLTTAIKQRSLFSATVTSGRILQKIADLRDGILRGTVSFTEARVQMKALHEEMGYRPEPGLAGGLQDLSSTQRVNVQLETPVDIAQGAGWQEQGMEPMVLAAFPAQELVRFFGPNDSTKQRDWPARWAIAGGTFYGKRMIALKTDPVWAALGNSDTFPDALGNDYPPFAFNSGMGVQDIERDEAVELGLIGETDEQTPQPLDLNANLSASPDVRDADLRAQMEATGLGAFDADGWFIFKPAA